MPGARVASFKGASGILRDVDGVIVGIEFTDQNPLAGRGTPKPGQKKSDFHSLFAVLQVKVDGAETASAQPLFVGNADDFGITEDKMGLTGPNPLSKSSGWFIFLNSIVNPGGVEGSGFDESNFPDDDPELADYSALVGARVRFNWQKNEKATKKYGQKASKDGKKKYDREDLIVTAYYGQVDVDATPASTSAPAAGKTSTTAAAKGKKGEPNIPALSVENVLLALSKAKDNKLSKAKLSVKILTQMETADAETRQAVRDWAFADANLAGIDGVDYDAKTQMVSLTPDED